MCRFSMAEAWLVRETIEFVDSAMQGRGWWARRQKVLTQYVQ